MIDLATRNRARRASAHRKNAMASRHRLCITGLGTLALLYAVPSFAQDSGYYYGGLSGGLSQSHIDDRRIAAGLLGNGFATTTMSRDERSGAFKLFGGYQFNRYLALEGGYFYLGKFGYTSSTIPAGTLSGQTRMQGLNLDIVGTLPLTDRFSAIGRVGLQGTRAEDHFNGTGAVRVLSPNPSKTEANYKVGLGLQYEITRSFLVRGEVERYRVNDAVGHRGDINMYSVSLVFPLGRAPAAAPQMVADASPAPAPVVSPPPPPVVPATRRSVTFSADSLFRFDASTISTEGRTALDRFATEVRGTDYDMIRIEGHADRLGSAPYNLRLSQRRADAVKAYLAEHGGFAATKLTAVGRGEASPVTKPSDCKGTKATPALVACLQPDRRVEVEVSGTR